MTRCAIIGLGLMGGSLGLALKRRPGAPEVCGYGRREATRRLALERRAVDRAADSPQAAVRGADLVVFCVPVLSVPDLARRALPALAPGCLLTDVGSTKAHLCAEMRALLAGSPATFIGSHPIAGSEEAGLEAARADLYDGAAAVITPAGSPPDRAAELAAFWEGVGCRVIRMEPDEHDRLLARTSHLPHLVAALLAAAVHRGASAALGELCGTGFRDATRLAAGSADLWHDVVMTNREAIRAELAHFRGELDRLTALIEASDFEGVRRFLAQSRERRGELLGPGPRKEGAPT